MRAHAQLLEDSLLEHTTHTSLTQFHPVKSHPHQLMSEQSAVSGLHTCTVQSLGC